MLVHFCHSVFSSKFSLQLKWNSDSRCPYLERAFLFIILFSLEFQPILECAKGQKVNNWKRKCNRSSWQETSLEQGDLSDKMAWQGFVFGLKTDPHLNTGHMLPQKWPTSPLRSFYFIYKTQSLFLVMDMQVLNAQRETYKALGVERGGIHRKGKISH